MRDETNPVQLAIASSLMTNALQVSILQAMIRKGLLSHQEGLEVYEQALLMLETSQSASASQDVFKAARTMLEKHLHSTKV